MSFFRELVAYYTLIESTADAAANASGSDGGITPCDGGGGSSVGGHDKFGSSGFDSPLFVNGVPSSCSLYGVGLMVYISISIDCGTSVELPRDEIGTRIMVYIYLLVWFLVVRMRFICNCF